MPSGGMSFTFLPLGRTKRPPFHCDNRKTNNIDLERRRDLVQLHLGGDLLSEHGNFYADAVVFRID